LNFSSFWGFTKKKKKKKKKRWHFTGLSDNFRYLKHVSQEVYEKEATIQFYSLFVFPQFSQKPNKACKHFFSSSYLLANNFEV
jgi:hypothetical protein